MPVATDRSVAEERVVGMGELIVTDNRSAILASSSLGSGLGVVIYDPIVKVGGLWHPMLPTSAIDQGAALKQPGMFVDTGWPALIRLATAMGAQVNRLRLYLAGSAQVIAPDGGFCIGRHNSNALRKQLREAEIPVWGETIDGVDHRTMRLHIGEGILRIQSSGQIDEVRL